MAANNSEVEPHRKPKRVLVISLHRMGDNLQVTPIFEALKKSQPQAEIWVLTEKGFEGVFAGNPFLDRLLLFDRSKYAAAHFQSIEVLRSHLDPNLRELAATPFDLVINRQSSRQGALFSALAECGDRRGFTVDTKGEFVISDAWTRLLFAMVQSRRIDPFQLIDYHIRSAGGTPGETNPWIKQDNAEAHNFIARLGPKGNRQWIALQPGASTPWRQWPVENFARASRKLLESAGDLNVLILVSKAEMELAQKIEADTPMDLRSRLVTCDVPLPALPGILSKCDLLITNDTGPMHIAAAVGCRVLALYFAGSVANEVAPYGQNHLLLQARLDCIPCLDPKACTSGFSCKTQITPDAVSTAAHFMLGLTPELPAEAFSQIDVLQTRQSPGGLECVPLCKRPLDMDALHRTLYRALFLEALAGQAIDPIGVADTLKSRYTHIEDLLNSSIDINLSPINRFSRSPQEATALVSQMSALIGQIRSQL